MNILSLFDGMSCGQIALKELGVPVSKYYASEIDKHAAAQTQFNFPHTIQLGDVENWKSWDIDFKSIDLLLAGSPCQGFSFAGKQLAFDDPRSRLFFVFVDILNHIKALNPCVKFLLENVDMKRSHLEIISEYVGVYPVNINSNLVSAQNRNRWYWTNIRTKPVGLFGEIQSNIPLPKDRGIMLRDILESEVDEKYYLKNPKIGFTAMDTNSKGRTLRVGGRASQSTKHNFDLVCVAQRGCKNGQQLETDITGKTNCLTTVAKDNYILQRVRGFNKGEAHQKKTPALPANSWQQNNFIVTKNYLQWDTSGKGYKSQQDRAYYSHQKHGSLTISENKNKVFIQNRIRRLTPKECARLQTIPDWYQWIVSNTQIYKMLGNGWTVEVIVGILSFMFEKVENK